MTERAHVTSTEAIDAFRTALVVYVSKARPALEEASAEAIRTRIWLEHDQRVHWEQRLRQRTRELEQAQATLFSSRISTLYQESTSEIQAVRKAKQAVEEAREKLQKLRQWTRDFESKVQPLVKQLEKLDSVLSVELPNGIAHLSAVVHSLSAYAEVSKPSLSPPPAAPTDENPSNS